MDPKWLCGGCHVPHTGGFVAVVHLVRWSRHRCDASLKAECPLQETDLGKSCNAIAEATLVWLG
eukprot:311633-Chlamydomonas_euryale.AAC.4